MSILGELVTDQRMGLDNTVTFLLTALVFARPCVVHNMAWLPMSLSRSTIMFANIAIGE